MKKTLFLIMGCVLLSSMCFLIYSCVKKQDVVINPSGTIMTDVPSDLLQAAKDWHAAQIKVTTTTLGITTTASKGKLAPQWKAAKMEVLAGGKSLIVVDGPIAKLSAISKEGVVRKFVFTTDGNAITGGKIIEMYGTANYMASHNTNLLENYNDSKIAGDFSGAVITYDVNYNYISSALYKNGQVIVGGAKIIKGTSGQTITNKTTVNSLKVMDDDDCYGVYLDYYYYDSSGNQVIYDSELLYVFCDDDSNELGGNDGIGGGGGSGPPPILADTTRGDHHLNTSKIPPLTTTDTQLNNFCVFKTMEWVSAYFGTTINSGTFATSYLASLNSTLNTSYTMGYYNNNSVAPQYLVGFVSTYFYETETTDVTTAIDNGLPVMGTIYNDTHEVMITGYNNDGTYEYFDPQLGTYNHASTSTFTQTMSISGIKY